MFEMEQLPNEAMTYIIRLRKESAKYRAQLRDTRVNLEALEIENAALKAALVR